MFTAFLKTAEPRSPIGSVCRGLVKQGRVDFKPMNYVLMTPTEYEPYSAGSTILHLTLLPEEFTGSDPTFAWVSYLPGLLLKVPLSEILRKSQEQEQEF